jgi:threonine synthase
MPPIAFFESVRSRHRVPADIPQTLDPDNGEGLYARYDMEALLATASRDNPARYAIGSASKDAAESSASTGMWRYRDMLPEVEPVSLGEGWTPLIRSHRYPGLTIKEEGHNPTGSVKARGMSMTVSMARHDGFQHLAVASSGDAAGALSAYCAAAKLMAHVFVSRDISLANYMEAKVYGADIYLVDGPVSECARVLREEIKRQKSTGKPASDRWFDISAGQEPFRLEGEKTLGYELAEQLGWTAPKAVIYPAGAIGLAAIAKAFEEMDQLGWIASEPVCPRLYGVQGGEGQEMVPGDDETLASLLDYARHEGILLSRAGAAATAVYARLLETGELKPEDQVVAVNPRAGLKDVEKTAQAMHLRRPGTLPRGMPVGGIITPV